ncbi:MAG: alpha-glucosidase [Bacilli bacterium]|nr:alpha-glucosidase [Bacilli bacterium]
MERSRWYKDAFFYQIYPRSFCDGNGDGIGDIRGIISKIDYLKDLGINAVWLSPVYKSPNDDNGYDISDYRSINPEFGTLDDFKEMLEKMHKSGIKLIMDFVGNHTSDEHEWFIKGSKDKDSKYHDYYFFKEGKKNGKKPHNNWTSFFAEGAWNKLETGEYYLKLFSKKQPDLNWDNPLVRKEMKDILRYWLDLGVDGFRCDVITIISKQEGLPNSKRILPILRGGEYYINGPHVHEYIHELNKDVLSKYDCMTVGESVMITPIEALEYVKEENEELDMLFSFEHTDADGWFHIKWFLRKFNLIRFKKTLTKWQNTLIGNGWGSLYLENHDQPRCLGRFGTSEKYPYASSTMLATMMYFQFGTPFIYQGQEIGMRNISLELDEYEDIETANFYKIGRKLLFTKKYLMKAIHLKSRDNARTMMQWDKTNNAGFSKVKPWFIVNKNYQDGINVLDEENDPDSILNYYKKLIALRKGNKIVRDGNYIEYNKQSNKIYCYSRSLNNKTLLIIANFKGKDINYKLPKGFNNKDLEVLLTNYKEQLVNKDMVTLKPYQVYVLSI